MTYEGIPTSGYRTRIVPVPREPGTVTLLQLHRKGIISTFGVHGVIDTPEQYSKISLAVTDVFEKSPVPFFLPQQCTHVEIERGSGSNGVARWRLESLDVGSLPPLTKNFHGQGIQILAWNGGEVDLAFDFTDKKAGHTATMNIYSLEDGEKMEMESTGGTRGTARIFGPGYLRFGARGDWEIQLK